MNILVENLPEYRIAYVRHVGPYGPDNFHTMEKIKKWALSKDLLTDSSIILGIPQDNPETTLPEKCRYDACIVISENYQIDNSVSEREIPSGKYVICKVKHTTEAIQKAWSEIFHYIQDTGHRIDNKSIIERYIGDMTNNDFCELCVPIVPL
jgi:DNA gyrase inhibitor